MTLANLFNHSHEIVFFFYVMMFLPSSLLLFLPLFLYSYLFFRFTHICNTASIRYFIFGPCMTDATSIYCSITQNYWMFFTSVYYTIINFTIKSKYPQLYLFLVLYILIIIDLCYLQMYLHSVLLVF